MGVFVVAQSIFSGIPHVPLDDDLPPFGEAGQPKKHPKMKIVAEGQEAFTVPYAPRDTTLDGVAPVWTPVERAGRKPLLVNTGPSLEVMAMELTFGYRNPNRSIEKELRNLRQIAEHGKRIRVKFDDTAGSHRWRLTGFSQHVTMRQHGTNAPTRATCNLQFTEVSDLTIEVGPVSGGHQGGGGGGDKKWPKFHTVKKGDTLQALARRYYGDPELWRDIADANKIRKPRELKIGAKLRIPKPSRGVGVATFEEVQ